MTENSAVKFLVKGPFACFTRPEAKVERVSYPVMTPSAARGCLEAILWKPEFTWEIQRITVLKPVCFISIRRNEIQHKILLTAQRVFSWMEDSSTYEPYFADLSAHKSPYGDTKTQNRVQRHTLALRDVAYIIEAKPVLTPKAFQPMKKKYDVDELPQPNTVVKYVSMFNRRVAKGQCFQQPYLGIREFVADFVPADDSNPPQNDPVLGAENYDLGRMFFDFDYKEDGSRIPLFAPAKLKHGVLDVNEMRKQLSVKTAQEI